MLSVATSIQPLPMQGAHTTPASNIRCNIKSLAKTNGARGVEHCEKRGPISNRADGRMKKAGTHITVTLQHSRDPGRVAARSNWQAENQMGAKVINDAPQFFRRLSDEAAALPRIDQAFHFGFQQRDLSRRQRHLILTL